MLAAPLAGGAALLLVTLGRFDADVAWWNALLGLLLLALYPWARSRAVVMFALLPAAMWIAVQPPWGAMASAIILAGWLVLCIGPLPQVRFATGLWLPTGVGLAAAALGGVLAAGAGAVEGGHAVAFVVVLAAFRTAAVSLGATPPSAVLLALATGAYLGPIGLLIGLVEAVALIAALTAPPPFRMGLALGAPAALIGWL